MQNVSMGRHTNGSLSRILGGDSTARMVRRTGLFTSVRGEKTTSIVNEEKACETLYRITSI